MHLRLFTSVCSSCQQSFHTWYFHVVREFEKLRRLLQRRRHIKIELCVRLSVLRLFHVGHVVQNRRGALSLAWHQCRFHAKTKNEGFTAAGSRFRQNFKYEDFTSSFGRLRRKLLQKACRTCSTIIFPHSTNKIIYLWRCCCRCRHFLNSLKVSNRDYDGDKNVTNLHI